METYIIYPQGFHFLTTWLSDWWFRLMVLYGTAKEKYKVSKRMCWAIVLPSRFFILPRLHCLCRRGLLRSLISADVRVSKSKYRLITCFTTSKNYVLSQVYYLQHRLFQLTREGHLVRVNSGVFDKRQNSSTNRWILVINLNAIYPPIMSTTITSNLWENRGS